MTFRAMGTVAIMLLAASSARAQVPQMINYQGRVNVGGAPFTGNGYFKFAFVDNTKLVAYWSNDGTWVMPAGAAVPMPVNSVQVTIDKGLYSVMLGNPTAPFGMVTIPPSAFQNPVVYLRVWFSDNPAGPFVLQAPDLRVTSVGYAMNAETVVDGAISEIKLADKSVTARKLANDAVTTDAIKDGAVTAAKLAAGTIDTDQIANHAITEEKLADDSVGGRVLRENSVSGNELADAISLGDRSNAGQLKVWSGASTTASIVLEGADGTLSLNDGGNPAAVLGVRSAGGGELTFYQADGVTQGVFLGGDIMGNNSGGAIGVYNGAGDWRVYIDGDSGDAGKISLRTASGSTAITLNGGGTGSGGDIRVRNGSDVETVVINGAESSTDGAQVLLYNRNHGKTVEIDGDDDASGGWIGLYNSSGTKKIELDANASGGARITTDVLEIKGGSDLSENFDITSAAEPRAGELVCIDPERPGRLLVSTRAYDRTVAGVMSGAGGVKPGMLMGQRGTAADGKHPVALTGRVYCYADASNSAIQPGDLLTTSDVPGHAMKAVDHVRAQGAIIGKAMTGLAAGRGLVLVLVSLQ